MRCPRRHPKSLNLPELTILYITKYLHPVDAAQLAATATCFWKTLQPYINKVDPHECFNCPLCRNMVLTRVLSHMAPVCVCTRYDFKVYYYTPAERHFFTQSNEIMERVLKQCDYPGRLCYKCRGIWPKRKSCKSCNKSGRVLIHNDCLRGIEEIYLI